MNVTNSLQAIPSTSATQTSISTSAADGPVSQWSWGG
jgi:hypothetical protein